MWAVVEGLDNSGGDFQEANPPVANSRGGEFPGFGKGVAHGEHQPKGRSVEREADGVGKR
jgi:hypothetical protein